MPLKQEVVETSEMVEMCQLQPPPLSTSTIEAKKKKGKPPKRRKVKSKCKIITKIAMNKMKRNEKKARLLNELETTTLHMKHINSNICKKISK